MMESGKSLSMSSLLSLLDLGFVVVLLLFLLGLCGTRIIAADWDKCTEILIITGSD